MAEHAGLSCTDRDVAIEFESIGKAELADRLPAMAATPTNAIELAQRLPSKQFRKLDELLSDDLLCESLAIDFLDLDGAIECLNKLD